MVPMKQAIKISVKAAATVHWSLLKEFQGELKILMEEDYKALRKEIIERGFSFAIHVWENLGDLWILDGHQRLRTVRRMVMHENFLGPDLPINYVQADSLEEAKHKLLTATSQYGRMTPESTHKFMVDAGFDEAMMRETMNCTRHPEVPRDKFFENFFDPPKPNDNAIPPKSPGKIEHRCPNCGTKFTS